MVNVPKRSAVMRLNTALRRDCWFWSWLHTSGLDRRNPAPDIQARFNYNVACIVHGLVHVVKTDKYMRIGKHKVNEAASCGVWTWVHDQFSRI